MNITSSLKQYDVQISTDFYKISNLRVDDNTFYVIDEKLYRIYKDSLFNKITSNVYLIHAVEENKTIETALDICEKMTSLSAKRNAKLISFGGGIVQDVTGFVANILYRGIHWTFYPTTLLSACDSCIGGKTSLNYKKYKNLLGTFYAPDEINICTPFFKTLEERDFLSGLGEVFKFNFMLGEEGIDGIENGLEEILNRNDEIIYNVVKKSLLFKKDFVEVDEFDRDERIKLNYAHTFGHAFETMSQYAIPHGTAVALGLVVANQISYERGWLDEIKKIRMEELVWKIVFVDDKYQNFDFDEVLQCIKKDKKQIGDSITCVLLKKDFDLEIVHDIKEKEVLEALQYLFVEKKDKWSN